MTPKTGTTTVGATKQFVATATMQDGATKVVTSSSSWVSKTTATATISNAGLANGVKVGTSIIEATYQGIKGTANLTVS